MKSPDTEKHFLETEDALPQGDLKSDLSPGRFPVSKSRFPSTFPKMPHRFPSLPREIMETVSGKPLVGFPKIPSVSTQRVL